MDIPHWLSAPAFGIAIAAILGSLVPIMAKIGRAWLSRRASTNLEITLGDGNKVSIKASSLDSKSVEQIIAALTVIESKDKGGPNE
jgi:hypothetical protein